MLHRYDLPREAVEEVDQSEPLAAARLDLTEAPTIERHHTGTPRVRAARKAMEAHRQARAIIRPLMRHP